MRTITRRALATAAVVFCLPQPGWAQATGPAPGQPKSATTPHAVIELFTSQGCSSCPAADALLGKIAEQRKDIVALTLPTDTWDYLGWKDTLSNPKFGARQRAYAKAFRDTVYTPQAVINGAAHVNGASEAQIDKAISATAASRVPVRLWADAGRLLVEVAASHNPGGKEATVWLAVLTKKVIVPIERGENTGRTLTYHNVVRELTPIGMWSGKVMTAQFERGTIMRPDTDACAVLLQEGQGGPIIGAAMLERF